MGHHHTHTSHETHPVAQSDVAVQRERGPGPSAQEAICKTEEYGATGAVTGETALKRCYIRESPARDTNCLAFPQAVEWLEKGNATLAELEYKMEAVRRADAEQRVFLRELMSREAQVRSETVPVGLTLTTRPGAPLDRSRPAPREPPPSTDTQGAQRCHHVTQSRPGAPAYRAQAPRYQRAVDGTGFATNAEAASPLVRQAQVEKKREQISALQKELEDNTLEKFEDALAR